MKSTSYKIVSGTAYIGILSAVGRFASFIIIIIVTSILSLYEYGLITLALAVTGPIFAGIGLGLDKLVGIDIARYLGEGLMGRAKKLMKEFYAVRFSLMFVVLAIGWFFRSFLVDRYGSIIVDASLVILIYIIVQCIKKAYSTIIQAHQSFKLLAVLNGGEPYVRLIYIAIAAYLGALSVPVVLASYVVAPSAIIIIGFPFLIRILNRYRGIEEPQRSVLLATIKAHGKWESGLLILSSIIESAKYFLIKLVLSTEAVAVFSVAQSGYGVFAHLIPFKTVLNPIIAHVTSTRDKMRLLMSKSAKYIIFIHAAMAIGAIIISPYVIDIFFPKYWKSTIVLQILLLQLPLRFSPIIHSAALRALRQQRFIFCVAPLEIISLLVFGIPLMYGIGVYGAAIESILILILYIFVREWYLRKKFQLKTIGIKDMTTFDDTDKMLMNKTLTIVKNKLKSIRWKKNKKSD